VWPHSRTAKDPAPESGSEFSSYLFSFPENQANYIKSARKTQEETRGKMKQAAINS
jgi:hypothetical protein